MLGFGALFLDERELQLKHFTLFVLYLLFQPSLLSVEFINLRSDRCVCPFVWLEADFNLLGKKRSWGLGFGVLLKFLLIGGWHDRVDFERDFATSRLGRVNLRRLLIRISGYIDSTETSAIFTLVHFRREYFGCQLISYCFD